MRGSSIALRRSLRTRVTAASIAAAAALTGVVCLLLPHGYRVQGQDRLRNEGAGIGEAVAMRLQTGPDGSVALPPAAELAAWATVHPSLDRIVLFDADGAEIDRWPEGGAAWDGLPLPSGHVGDPPFLVVSHPIRPIDAGEDAAVGAHVGVRMSSALLLADVNEVRWLFGAIFLLMSGVFVVLTRYFSLSILTPLEDISRAAQSLADGEPMVQLPETGDREIDELGEVISRLGQVRRQSRVMELPRDVRQRLQGIDPQPDLPGGVPPEHTRETAASPLGKE
jgi:hypothetical protein